MTLNLNPEYVERLASEAFWNFVHKYSLQETGFPTKIEDIPKGLWSQEILIRMLMLMKDGIISENAEFDEKLINELYYAVAETIIDHNQRNQNIIGVIYVEDFQFCKDPSFRFDSLIDELKSDSNKECSYNIKLKGKYINEGDLLLSTAMLNRPPRY